ncbi:MAG: phage tail assembly protein [Pseudomonadota bacterium]
MIQTEYEFKLPIGYPDEDGNLHREGVMRLATAADEITPLRDGRVQSNPAYLIIILLSRVVTRLGCVVNINPKIIENLFAADLAYLQKLYNEINQVDQGQHITASCPQCNHKFALEKNDLGGL